MARELAPSLWVFDRPLSVFGLRIGTRMTAVRLSDGGLFLHSPVEPDPETCRELDALGPVRCVVAPSKVHHFFVEPYREAYPEAQHWAAPGLAEKRSELRFDHELGDTPPAAWADEIDQCLFGGIPYVNEVVFLHRASRTLILTDLAMNHVENDSLWTRMWLRLNGIYGHFGASRLMKTIVRDRTAARASLERILSWDFERIVVTHGVVLQRHGKRLVRDTFAWLD